MGKLSRAISDDGGVVVSVVDSTDIVKKMKKMHGTAPAVTVSLGRLFTGGSLMGIMQKSKDDTLTVRIDSNGPCCPMIVISDYLGNVRGYCEGPQADAESPEKVVGNDGIITVVRSFSSGEPYVGKTRLVSGKIGEDITNYFAVSEQTPNACSVGVLLDDRGEVTFAGGYLLQLLPGVPEEDIVKIEANMRNMSPVTALLKNGCDVDDIVEMLLKGFSPNIIDSFTVSYKCSCSRKRVEGTLASIGRDDLVEIIEDGKDIELECSYCDKVYRFSCEELKKIADKLGYFN